MTEEDFDAWRKGIAGKWFFDEAIVLHIEHYRTVLANGGCGDEDPLAIAMKYKEIVGVIAGLEYVRNLDPFEDGNETESNRETSPNQDGR